MARLLVYESKENYYQHFLFSESTSSFMIKILQHDFVFDTVSSAKDSDLYWVDAKRMTALKLIRNNSHYSSR